MLVLFFWFNSFSFFIYIFTNTGLNWTQVWQAKMLYNREYHLHCCYYSNTNMVPSENISNELEKCFHYYCGKLFLFWKWNSNWIFNTHTHTLLFHFPFQCFIFFCRFGFGFFWVHVDKKKEERISTEIYVCSMTISRIRTISYRLIITIMMTIKTTTNNNNNKLSILYWYLCLGVFVCVCMWSGDLGDEWMMIIIIMIQNMVRKTKKKRK